jgi:hypothetical protein
MRSGVALSEPDHLVVLPDQEALEAPTSEGAAFALWAVAVPTLVAADATDSVSQG